MDIRQFAVKPMARLHLRDAADQLMYADGDTNKPIAVNLYGPGSKQFVAAQSEQSSRMLEKLKAKGKTNQTAEQKLQESAEFLVGCTESFENMQYENLTGVDLARAVYTDITIGFIADQATRFVNDWENFTKPSTKG